MYISASKQFDKIIVWEQRTNRTKLNIRTFNAPNECYVRMHDWKACKTKLKEAVDEGNMEDITILKQFLGLGANAIDTAETHLSMYNEPLYKLTFSKSKEFKAFTGSTPVNIRLYESDIPPELKVLSANYYQADLPILNVTFYDIEVEAITRTRNPEQSISVRSVMDGTIHEMKLRHLRKIDKTEHDQYEYKEKPTQPFRPLTNSPLLYDEFDHYPTTMTAEAPINSIAFYHAWLDEYVCYCVPPNTWSMEECQQYFNWDLFKDIPVKYKVVFCQNEAELLTYSVEEIQNTDVLSGYNSSMFDDPYFAQRVETVLGEEWFLMLSFPKGKKPYYTEREIFFRPQKQVSFDGRITTDYLEIFKKFTVEDRDSWSLESVAQDHLGEKFKKLDYEGTLHSLYHENFPKFVRYNIRDTEILRELDRKYKFIQTGNSLIHQSTCHYKNIVGTIRTAEMSINNYCWHELGMRVPDTQVLDEQGQAEGAYVLVPQTGLQDWLICVDINSLYPNTERTLNLSPETIMGQFTEFGKAWEEIFHNTDTPLTLKWEKTNRTDTLPACEWRKKLWELKCSVSGYGTVFDQTKEGIIPQLLGKWYADRKAFQAAAKKAAARKSELEKNGGSQEEIDAAQSEYEFNDMAQYAMKIKLNSQYGALLNQNFRFYDKRMGQSVTATGRRILQHQLRKGCEIIDGDYNIDPIVDDEDPRALRGEIASPCLIYGDTDSGYFSIKSILPPNASAAFAIKLSDQIAAEINASFPEFNQKAFLCQPGYDGFIKTGRELVADRGFFIQKKRYVIHVIDKEGKAKDELKAMGVEMRKTTTPRDVKVFLRTSATMLLKGTPDKELDEYIVTYRDKIIDDVPLMELGLPKGIKKIEYYTDEFRADPRTRLPGHVAAALLYNEFRDHHKDNQSLQISSGMKIKVFNFKYEFEHEGRMFNSIALPTDTEEIPNWFVEEFAPQIDRVMHSKKLVDNMLHNMFDSIPRHVPTRHMQAIEEEFEFN
jgi:DNA polymerase elongation subunit (family B)